MVTSHCTPTNTQNSHKCNNNNNNNNNTHACNNHTKNTPTQQSYTYGDNHWPAKEIFVMDFSYDWLSAQIRHDLNKFLLFFIAYFPCFGPNKKNPKCRNKLNFIVSTCRSFGCPLYSHVQNVPALVSHDEMEGKRPTNKPKAMEDDDATLSADDFASVVRTTTDTS